jgi:hypothetical protein
MLHHMMEHIFRLMNLFVVHLFNLCVMLEFESKHKEKKMSKAKAKQKQPNSPSSSSQPNLALQPIPRPRPTQRALPFFPSHGQLTPRPSLLRAAHLAHPALAPPQTLASRHAQPPLAAGPTCQGRLAPVPLLPNRPSANLVDDAISPFSPLLHPLSPSTRTACITTSAPTRFLFPRARWRAGARPRDLRRGRAAARRGQPARRLGVASAAPAWLTAPSRGQRGSSSPGTATRALARRAGLVRGEMDCGHTGYHRIES